MNTHIVKANYKTQPGDHVILNIPDLQTPDIKPENIPLDILYEDEWLMVVNKPKDMVDIQVQDIWRERWLML